MRLLLLLGAIRAVVVAALDSSSRHFRDNPTYDTGCKNACVVKKGDTLSSCVINCQQCLYREGCKELAVCQTCNKEFQPTQASSDFLHDRMPEPKKPAPIRPVKIEKEGIGVIWYVLAVCLIILIAIVVCTSKGLKA